MPGVKISELPSAALLENTDYIPLARPGAGGGATYKILGAIFGRQTDITDLYASKVNKSGDTMTGKLTLDGAPTSDLHAATKKYVDDKTATISDKVNRNGDTMTGKLTLDGAPTLDLHAATKKYVDDRINALNVTLTNLLNAKTRWAQFECEDTQQQIGPFLP